MITFIYGIGNGGKTTYEELDRLTQQEQINLNYLLHKKLIYHIILTNINNKELILTHAGLTPPFTLNEQDIIWDRTHIKDNSLNFIYKDTYIIHGHTPVISDYFNESIKKPRVVEYCNKHKICVDMGAFKTKIVACLDLDSIGTNNLKIQYFNKEGVINYD